MPFPDNLNVGGLWASIMDTRVSTSQPKALTTAIVRNNRLPPRFIKVRYYGLLSPAQRQRLRQARQLLSTSTSKLKSAVLKPLQPLALLTCPQCRAPLTLLGPLAPRGRAP